MNGGTAFWRPYNEGGGDALATSCLQRDRFAAMRGFVTPHASRARRACAVHTGAVPPVPLLGPPGMAMSATSMKVEAPPGQPESRSKSKLRTPCPLRLAPHETRSQSSAPPPQRVTAARAGAAGSSSSKGAASSGGTTRRGRPPKTERITEEERRARRLQSNRQASLSSECRHFVVKR